jgi:D-glycero-alpha-D-manno-heptose-7-phosphate kinase
LDQIYAGAINNGAIGGKILGAGGGGCFLFFVPPFNRLNVINYLISLGLNVKPFIFEKNGLKSWKTRQHYTS